MESYIASEIRAPSVVASATSSSHAQCASHGFHYIKIHFDIMKAPCPGKPEQRANILRGTTSGLSTPHGNAPLRVRSHTGSISGAPGFPYYIKTYVSGSSSGMYSSQPVYILAPTGCSLKNWGCSTGFLHRLNL